MLSRARLSVKLSDRATGDLDECIRLCSQNLSSISKLDDIKVPKYDRSEITPGVVNLGLRNFHRVHNASFFDDLLHSKANSGWGMISVGLSESHRRAYDALKMQNSLYTMVARSPNGESQMRVLGSVLDVLQAPQENSRVVELIGSKSTKMVTLTIKEGSYFMNRNFSRFDTTSPQISYDLVQATVPSRPPRTAIGMLVAGLHKRYLSKSPPLTILCCDNLIRGGEITRVAVETFALHRFPLEVNFHQWLTGNVFYPNTVCDRICLTDPSEDKIGIQQTLGIRDDALLTTETYSKWYIEKWMGAKPEGLGHVPGVELVSSTEGFENLKIRLNYGSRLSLALVAHALGVPCFEDALSDPAMERFLRKYMEEAELGLGSPVPKSINLEEYKNELITRISTKQLKYMTNKVVEDSVHKVRMDIQPVIASLPAEAPTETIAFALSVWAHLLAGTDMVEKHASNWHPLVDGVHAKELVSCAKNLVGTGNTGAVEFLTHVFGEDLARKNNLDLNLVKAVKDIDVYGIRGALRKRF